MKRYTVRFVALFIAVTMIFVLSSPFVFASVDSVAPYGSGTEEDPWRLTSAGNLIWINADTNRTAAGRHMILLNSITAPENFRFDNSFGGYFQGNGNTIWINQNN